MSMPAVPTTFEAFAAFHDDTLRRARTQSSWASAVADATGLGSIAFRTPIGTVTWACNSSGGFSAETEAPDAATDADALVEVATDAWWGLMHDYETIPGLLYGGKGTLVSGKPGRVLRWEAPLRAILHDIPIFDTETIDLRDVDGTPLDVTRSFSADEILRDATSAQHFLKTAGFMAVRGVFSKAEVAAFQSDVAQLEAEATQGDQASWWGKDGSGNSILTRVLRGSTRPALRALVDDSRVRAIVDCFGEQMVVPNPDELDGVTVIYKRSEMVEGLADLPWHRDCGMGGHAHMCPSLVMSIYVTEGNASTGELRVLPGSHRTSAPFIDERTSGDLGIGVPMNAGDVSLHITDVMHASMPPTSVAGPHRVAVLLGFTRPIAHTHDDGLRHYNDALLAAEDGQVTRLGG